MRVIQAYFDIYAVSGAHSGYAAALALKVLAAVQTHPSA
jgi:hypothetical protein